MSSLQSKGRSKRGQKTLEGYLTQDSRKRKRGEDDGDFDTGSKPRGVVEAEERDRRELEEERRGEREEGTKIAGREPILQPRMLSGSDLDSEDSNDQVG